MENIVLRGVFILVCLSSFKLFADRNTETHICIKEDMVLTYYLSKPNLENKVCELHSPTHVTGFLKPGLCENKMRKKMIDKITDGFRCYCSSAFGNLFKVIEITENGYICGEEAH